eukprot:7375835-Prymnesium_polylepis.1
MKDRAPHDGGSCSHRKSDLPVKAAASAATGSSHDQRQARRVEHCARRATSAGGGAGSRAPSGIRVPSDDCQRRAPQRRRARFLELRLSHRASAPWAATASDTHTQTQRNHEPS